MRRKLRIPSRLKKVQPNIKRAVETLGKERQRAIPYATTMLSKDPSTAEQISPTEEQAHNQSTDIYTLITEIGGTNLLYSSESWVTVRLILETAGPVAVSTRQELTPTLSGRGILLITDEPITFTLPRGDRLYYTADSVNRVRIIIEPVPWLGQISLGVQSILRAFRSK